MPSLLANGETLSYYEEGAGPAILFVHSLGANSSMWRPVIAALKDSYRCIAIDCRGHGKTSYKGKFTVADVAADLNAALDQLEVKRAHLVGLSMGGPILLEMYASRPGRIASLVLAGGFYDQRATAAERLAGAEAQLKGKTMLDFGREYAKSRLMPATAQVEHEKLAEALAMVAPDAYLDTVRAIFSVGFQGLLAAVSVPTLICFGDKESAPLQEQGRQMHAAIAGSELAVVAGSGHLIAIDQPAVFAKLIGDFVARAS